MWRRPMLYYTDNDNTVDTRIRIPPQPSFNDNSWKLLGDKMDELVDDYIKHSHPVIKLFYKINDFFVKLIEKLEPRTKAYKEYNKKFDKL